MWSGACPTQTLSAPENRIPYPSVTRRAAKGCSADTAAGCARQVCANSTQRTHYTPFPRPRLMLQYLKESNLQKTAATLSEETVRPTVRPHPHSGDGGSHAAHPPPSRHLP